MEVSTIQTEIQHEVHTIINILEKIQSELDELNEFTKPGGTLDSAISNGLQSSQAVYKTSGCTLTDINHMNITEMHSNVMNSTIRDSELVTQNEISLNNSTQ